MQLTPLAGGAMRDPAQEERETVGLSIVLARKLAGVTPAGLAEHTGVDVRTVSRWERGRVLPNPGHLREIAAYFDRSRGWFYDDHTAELAALEEDDELGAA